MANKTTVCAVRQKKLSLQLFAVFLAIDWNAIEKFLHENLRINTYTLNCRAAVDKPK